MLAGFAADSYSFGYRAGYFAGRLIWLALLPVLIIALIYWLSGRSRTQPMPFSHAISRWWVWVAGLLTGFVLLVGAGLGLAAPAAQRQATLEASVSPVPEPTVPNGFALQRDAAGGFELALPTTWVAARATNFDADVAAIAQSHPDVADVLKRLNQAMAGKGMKLIAADPSQPSGYYTNVLVLAYDAGFGPSLDQAAGDYVSGLESNAQIAKPVGRRRVSLPAGPAMLIEDHATGSIAFSQVTYLLLHGQNGKSLGYLLLLSSATDQLPTAQPVFEQMAKTFRFTG